jgi:hypothetical protein
MNAVHDACPRPEALTDWVEGTVPDEARAELVRHVEGCESCREAVAMLEQMRSSSDAARARSERPPASLRGGSTHEAENDSHDDGTSPLPGPGDQIGRFRIEKVLGRGGMGVVLLARDERLDRDVALKIARGDRGASERLREEGRSLAALRHPNLVAVHEVGEAEGRPYLVMELVRGQHLRADVALHRPEWRVTLERCLEAAKGVEALHAARLVHRDIKPDNLMLADDGRVVVVDLGLARRSGEPHAPESGRTRSGAIVGTPRYLAPERVAGAPANVATDVYALAATTLELVRASRGVPPPSLVATLTSALDPDPKERPRSVAELRAQIEASVATRWGRWLALAAISGGALAIGVATRVDAPKTADPIASGSSEWVPAEFSKASGDAIASGAAGVLVASTDPPGARSSEAPVAVSGAILSATSIVSAAASVPSPASTSVVAPSATPPPSSGPSISGPAASAALAAAVANGNIQIDPRPLPPVFSREWMERMDWPARTFETGYAKIHDGYEPCGGDPKPEAIPRGLDWGTVEKREVLELQTKEGKPNKSLLVMVKGQRGHAAFVGFRDGSYLDSEIGDWVLIRGVGRPSTDVLPPSWGAVKQYHFSEFAPIAGPPAWTKRDPAPKHLPCGPTLEFGGARSAGGEPSPPGKSVSDDKLDFDAERIWPHGDGAFLFKVAVPPKTPLADGPSYIDGFIAEAPASLKNLELLDKATRKLPIWVIGRFVRVQSGDGSRLPVMRLEEVLPRLFEPPKPR